MEEEITRDMYGNPYYINSKEPYNGCAAAIVAAFIVFIVCVALSGCSPKVVERVTVKTDTCYITKHQRDSIWQHDSIYLHEYEKGDTVYVELTKWKYRIEEKLRTDTLYVSKTDSIVTTKEVEKKLTRWQKFRMDLGTGTMIGAVLLLVLWIVYKKIRL